jgi:hypothetical protein
MKRIFLILAFLFLAGLFLAKIRNVSTTRTPQARTSASPKFEVSDPERRPENTNNPSAPDAIMPSRLQGLLDTNGGFVNQIPNLMQSDRQDVIVLYGRTQLAERRGLTWALALSAAPVIRCFRSHLTQIHLP